MSDKLVMALKARLPIISVTTQDTLNHRAVVEELVGMKVGSIGELKASSVKTLTTVYTLVDLVDGSLEMLYRGAAASGRCIILVNTDEESPLLFQGGQLPTPKAMLKATLDDYTNEPTNYLPYTGGLTIKDLTELLRLTLARDDTISPEGLAQSRSQYSPKMTGVEPVDTQLDYYHENVDLTSWLATNSHFFLSHDEDERLTPRGLLLGGPPGTGKTLGAKYLANNLGVPLYRLDLSGMMSKWLGDAESNLRRALAQIEQESPCVMLLDEVEKLFQSGGEQETTSRILGYMLWWMQEHRSRVLTVMTTNNTSVVPPELYRPGRIDSVVIVGLLNTNDAGGMAGEVLDTFDLIPGLRSEVLAGLMDAILPAEEGEGKMWSHAEVTETVHQLIKEKSKKYI